jgi:hypothetical protein
MKKIVIFLLVLIVPLRTDCQNEKKILSHFPVLQKADTIMKTHQLFRMCRSKESSKNILDTMVALHYFFDDNVEKMHDIEYGYNPDTHEDFYTPYTKKVYPLYKKKN